MGRESELLHFPSDDDPDGQAEALAEWIDDVEATFSAAVSLEPLDPYGEEGRALKDSLDGGDYGEVVRGAWL